MQFDNNMETITFYVSMDETKLMSERFASTVAGGCASFVGEELSAVTKFKDASGYFLPSSLYENLLEIKENE